MDATREAMHRVRAIADNYEQITTIDVGGGLSVPYRPTDRPFDLPLFAGLVADELSGYDILLEPGRYIVADAGLLPCCACPISSCVTTIPGGRFRSSYSTAV